jgi:hypothetical protein
MVYDDDNNDDGDDDDLVLLDGKADGNDDDDSGLFVNVDDNVGCLEPVHVTEVKFSNEHVCTGAWASDGDETIGDRE